MRGLTCMSCGAALGGDPSARPAPLPPPTSSNLNPASDLPVIDAPYVRLAADELPEGVTAAFPVGGVDQATAKGVPKARR